MNTTLLIASNVMLWLGFIGLAVLVMGLIRQIGLLHERSAPLGAMMLDHGPDIGEQSPVFQVDDFYGVPLAVGQALTPGRPSLLMFTGPTCPICAKLFPIIRSVAQREGADVVLVSDGNAADHRKFLAEHDMGEVRYVVSAEIGMKFQVAKIPYGVLLDEQGMILAKGLCNTREHVESLFETVRLGHPSLQKYMREKMVQPADIAPQLH
ncbi:methylamine dehydrogenase accessory protein MauD [Advenella incenata]|jgi:methylamine dehydrogenase accessory protein MauD|uniref:Methylamine utilization protein MauD n=1 Tax=Advenella incenata TaxID=267800 RepID=A0A4Q7V5A7_9BURK|nr:methylamine dehydrogenase accessory protein MauD [Advenella incenata]RZT91455.1 methylamine dehydrogenase accessory protein MauD [Advenella incenata]